MRVRLGLLAVISAILAGCGGSSAPTTAPPAGLRVVGLGDSYMAAQDAKGRTFVDVYAAALAATRGSPVSVDLLTDDSNTTARLLESLRSDAAMRSKVAAADVVVVSVGGNDSDPFGVYPKGLCAPAAPLAACLAGYAPTFEANYDAIFAAIEAIRAGKRTALRVTSADDPFVGWSEAPSPTFAHDFFGQVALAETQAACAVGRRHGALCVDYLHLFGGPTGLADPAPFLAPDHNHPGDRGILAIGDELAKLGLPELA